MNVEADLVCVAGKTAVASKLVAVTSPISLTQRSGFSLSGMYLYIYVQRLIH